MDKPELIIQKPRDIFKLISDSWKLFKDNFWLFSKIVLLVQVPLSLISLIFSLYLSLTPLKDENALMIWGSGQNLSFLRWLERPEVFGSLVLLILILVFVMIYFSFISNIALTLAVGRRAAGEGIDLKSSYKEAFPLFWSYLWVTILAGLLILGGLILLIIPGIIFSVWFAFVGFIVVLEKIKGVAALKRSKELVKNYFWYVLLYAILIFVLIASVTFFLGLPLTVARTFLLFSSSTTSLILSNIISTLSNLIGQIVGILGICAFILIYFDLKKIKEGK